MPKNLLDFLFGHSHYSGLENGLASMARLIFILTLFMFFWNSALTKFDGFGIADGAYYQIFPKAFEAAGFDSSGFPFWRRVVVWLGSISELILPLMIAFGFLTRLAALGMIGFIVVMTFTDMTGHGVAPGRWFDSNAADVIADLRLYWLLIFSVLIVHGGGWLSLDRLLSRFVR